jgi:nitroimidazol reductase NimA-like FMN-containing flavoprotein (pyridoxamine 5'-phosphate oxidase superfamily)
LLAKPVCADRDQAAQALQILLSRILPPRYKGPLMPDRKTGDLSNSPASPLPGHDAQPAADGPERLSEAECLQLISPGGVGRLAYTGRFGPTVLPVNYKLHQGTIVFRTAHDSSVDEDLRTGIQGAEFKVAFEIDDISPAAREGWSVLVQGSAHHVESAAERASVLDAGVEPWAGGTRELFVRIIPTRITGRHVRQS